MTTKIHPVVLRASTAAVFVVEVVELMLNMLLALIQHVADAVFYTLEVLVMSSQQRARLASIRRAEEKRERQLEKKRRADFIWSERERAKAMRDYGPKSSGGLFSKLCSLLTWAAVLYVSCKFILPHVMG